MSPEERRRDFLRILGDFEENANCDYEVVEPAPLLEDDKWRKLFLEYADETENASVNYVLRNERPEGYEKTTIKYPGAINGDFVYANLRIPDRLEKKTPAVLCLHGHVAGCFFGKEWMDATAVELTRAGFVTLAPDMLPFGDRRLKEHDEDEWVGNKGSSLFIGERKYFQTLALKGQSLLGLHVAELRSAIGILQNLDCVDPSRIGTCGHSGGGVDSMWLAAMDTRIACAVVSAGVQSYSQMAEEQYLAALWNIAPILTVGDTVDVIKLVAPRPFVTIEGEKDDVFNAVFNRERIYPAVAELYNEMGAGDNFVNVSHSGGHGFSLDFQVEEMKKYLREFLRP